MFHGTALLLALISHNWSGIDRPISRLSLPIFSLARSRLRDSRVRSISKARSTKLKREETGSYFRVPFTCASFLLSAEPGTGYLLISYSILLPVIYKWDLGSIDIYFQCLDDELSMTQYYYGNLSPSRRRKTRKNKDILRTKQAIIHNLVPRALFPGFGGGAGKAREKRPGDEVA